MEIVKDFYTGFEGEPEIIFYFQNSEGQKVQIKAWIGYFDSIMAAIQPNENGWSGLSYYYHTDTGWFEETPWRIPDLGDALNGLQSVNKTELDQETLEVYRSIFELLHQAQSVDREVLVEYD
ncbi:dihydroorotate dehydrogenase (quinone) [Paenibacillus sp. sgz500992]|uniref:dihydroorotate dehydrogenase (quinone) n=1 Tax=Paenibacillus sp. sgz500992 TaxID=3242476 RepID=UPI0036D30570